VEASLYPQLIDKYPKLGLKIVDRHLNAGRLQVDHLFPPQRDDLIEDEIYPIDTVVLTGGSGINNTSGGVLYASSLAILKNTSHGGALLRDSGGSGGSGGNRYRLSLQDFEVEAVRAVMLHLHHQGIL